MIRAAGAFVLAVALAAPVAAAPAHVTVVDAGGALAFAQSDPSVPIAGLLLLVRAGLDRESAKQNGLAALTAEALLRTPIASAAQPDSVALADAVDAAGASIGYAVGAQSVRFYLEGTPDGVARAAPLVASVLAKGPAADAASLAAARAALAERIAGEEDDPRLVGRAMVRSAYYRGGAALPPFGNPAALTALGPADVSAFYASWYLRGDAIASAVGNTGPATDAASRELLGALRAGNAQATVLVTRPAAAAGKRIVTHREVGAPYVVLGFAAPALGERDFPAALVLRALLSNLFERTGASSAAMPFRSTGALYGYDAAPAQLVLWINGGRVDPEQGLAGIDAIAKAASAKPLGAAVLARFKETARGQWALETVALDARASAIGGAVAHGFPPDTADGVGAAIARVTAADVLRVAKRYLRTYDVALVLPRGNGN